MKLSKEIREYKAEEYLWVRPDEACWVELDVETLPDRDGDVFIRAKIDAVDLEKRMVTVTYEDPDFQASPDVHVTRIMKRDPNTYPELNDLVDLPVLNDSELHQKIRDRFAQLNIFTYIGPSLLIINPFKFLPDQYKESLKKEFYDCIMNPSSNKVRDKPPHVWAIAAQAYLDLYNNKMNQACCISGESGAGKTVNTKTCMSFLTGMNDIFGAKGAGPGPGEARIEDKILMCNPILEALGNAKTVRNDNSSRFGKYVSLYMKNKIVIGASVESYLLEAIRVTTPNKSERNYHVFYQLLKGGSEADINKYRLNRKPATYNFLERSGCYDVPTVDDVAEYKDHEKSMETLNLKGDWRDAYWRIIGSVLHISNIKYDDTYYNGSNACQIPSTNVLDDIAENLQCDRTQLIDALTCKTSVVMGKEIVIYLDKAGCISQSEAFGKDIYNKLFSWVIKYLNLALLPEAEKASGQDPAKIHQKIGLLDIFGFEIFELNSIEQLCINFTNEKLHQLYVEYVFKLEVQTFIDEGLKQYLANLNFNDNQEVIDLLAHPDTKKFSVFNLIDDQAATMSKDMNLIDQFMQVHGKNSKMQFSKTKRNMFFIVHTARAVGYTIDGFCEKNKDEVPRPVIKCVIGSRHQRIVDIYCQKIKDTDTPVDYLGEAVKKKESFIGYKFRQQMDALMNELRSCQCSFMRCIKPNEAKSATVWTSSLVVLQIRYLGLLDSIKIRKESYPFRFQFKQFVHRYLELEPAHSTMTPDEVDKLNPDYKTLCQNILKNGIPQHGDKTQLVGKTRVFLKIEAYQHLEEAYEKAVKVKKDAIKVLDKILLEIKLRDRIMMMRRKGTVAVAIINQMLFGMKTKQTHRKFKLIRKTVLKLQANFRGRRALRLFRKKRQSVSTVQSAIEAFVAQKKAKEKVNSAKTIARYYKNYKQVSSLNFYVELMKKIRDLAFKAVEQSMYKNQIKSAIAVQKRIRGWLVRRQNAFEVQRIKTAKDLFKYNKAIKILRKFIVGKITRRRVKKIMVAASKIQAYVKMKWTRKAYLNMKDKTIFIQRKVRDWLHKKRRIDKKRIDFLRNEYIPFLKKCHTDQSRLYKVDTGLLRKKLGRDEDMLGDAPKTHQAFEQIPEVDSTCIQKIRIYTEVIDLDYQKDIVSCYQGSWSKGLIDATKDTRKIKTDARVIEVGARHTVLSTINGRCYCWGRNENYQLGTDQTEETMAVFRVLKGEEKLRYIATGDDHTHILTRDRAVFSYGRNDLGQLGLGHNRHSDKIELNNLLTRCKLTSIHAKKHESWGVTEEGELLFWPVSPKDYSIGILSMPHKETVNIVSLGTEFMMILANSGNLFALGRENRQGQLGVGHTNPVLSPTHISHLNKERIIQVSCGDRHTICLTRNTKIFTWGAGSNGQLGVGDQNNYLLPIHVKLPPTPSKPIQVCASFQGSYSLMEDGVIFWWGRNSRAKILRKPTLFRNLSNQELFPLQIRSSWSENLNVTYLEVADFRYIPDMNISQKHTYAKLMAQKWNTLNNSQFELPASTGYGPLVTSKNYESTQPVDLKRPKPDPLETIPKISKLYMHQQDIRSPIKSSMTSPAKASQFFKKSPTINVSSPVKQYTSVQGFNSVQPPIQGTSPLQKTSPTQYGTGPAQDTVGYYFTPETRTIKRQAEALKKSERDTSPYKSSARIYMEKTPAQKMDEMIKSQAKKKTSSPLAPRIYEIEELMEMKKNLKSLLMKPRKQWTQKDQDYFTATKDPAIQEQLKSLK